MTSRCWVLPDVEPRALGGDSAPGGGVGRDLPARAWTIRRLLERRARQSGHAWQGRFYSCPLDAAHLWTALRYAELNPVRARMVDKAVEWPWSSAAAHCGMPDPGVGLEMTLWRRQWSEITWRKFLDEGESESELRVIRRCTHTGRPLGPSNSSRTLEERTDAEADPAPARPPSQTEGS